MFGGSGIGQIRVGLFDLDQIWEQRNNYYKGRHIHIMKPVELFREMSKADIDADDDERPEELRAIAMISVANGRYDDGTTHQFPSYIPSASGAKVDKLKEENEKELAKNKDLAKRQTDFQRTIEG